MDGKLYASGSSVLKVAELAKTALNEHEARLDSLDSVEPDEIVLKTPVTSIPSNAHTRLTLHEVQGNTVQNHLPLKTNSVYYVQGYNGYKIKTNSTTKDYNLVWNLKEVPTLKRNTVYTYIFTVEKNTITQGNSFIALDGFESFIVRTGKGLYAGETGFFKHKFTTATEDDTRVTNGIKMYVRNNNLTADEEIWIKDIMILEGDWTNRTDIPDFFTGIQSADSVQVKAVGKNLFNLNEWTIAREWLSDAELLDSNAIKITNNQTKEASVKEGDSRVSYTSIEKVLPKGVYTLSTYIENVKGTCIGRVYAVIVNSDGTTTTLFNKDAADGATFKNNFTLPSKCKVRFYFYSQAKSTTTLTESTKIYKNIQVEPTDIATEFEPYQETTFQIPLEEPLRSLPNGVCDYIKDGKIVRNTNKVTFNIDDNTQGFIGEYTHANFETYTDYLGFVIANSVNGITNPKYYPNTVAKETGYSNVGVVAGLFNALQPTNSPFTNSNVFLCYHSSGNIYGSIKKALLETQDMNGVRKYFRNIGHIELVYQLATPIIEELPLPNNGILRSYENGHLLLENTPVRPVVTFNYKSGLKGAINDMQVDIENHEVQLRSLQVTETGEQVLTKRVNGLELQDGNVKVEEIKGNTVQNLSHGFTTWRQFGEWEEQGDYMVVTSLDENQQVARYVIDYRNNSDTIRMLKPSTTYTFIFSEYGVEHREINVCDIDENGQVISSLFYGALPSNNAFKFTTPQSMYRFAIYPYAKKVGDKLRIKNNFIILEGDWTGKEIPSYFTGIKSVNEEQTGLKLRSVGKNLFNMQNATFSGSSRAENITDNEFTISNNGNTFAYANIVIKNLKPYTTYTISFHSELIAGSNTAMNTIYGHNASDNKQMAFTSKHPNGDEYREFNFTTLYDKDIRFYVYASTTVTDSITVRYYNFQLEEGDTKTPYEPYKESTITIPYTEPLRKLPNGVCDTVEDGKVVRRVGKMLLNGSEQWYQYHNMEHAQGLSFYLILENKKIGYQTSITSNFSNVSDSWTAPYKERYAIFSDHSIHPNIYFRPPNNTITTLSEYKTWLASNNVTLLYQLNTPIEEEIPEISLYGYKHLIFDNDIIPSEATISFAESNYSRLVALEETNVAQSKTIAELCAMVDALTLQIGNLL